MVKVFLWKCVDNFGKGLGMHNVFSVFFTVLGKILPISEKYKGHNLWYGESMNDGKQDQFLSAISSLLQHTYILPPSQPKFYTPFQSVNLKLWRQFCDW